MISLYPESSKEILVKTKNEKGKVTIDTTEIQRIIKDYYKQLCINKIAKLEEKDKFPEMYNLPRLNKEETENMNRPVTSTEIEAVILKLNRQKSRTR